MVNDEGKNGRRTLESRGFCGLSYRPWDGTLVILEMQWEVIRGIECSQLIRRWSVLIYSF